MRKLIGLIALCAISSSWAAGVTIEMHRVAKVGQGSKLGTVRAVQYKNGVLFIPQLKGFKASPAIRGFHVHEGSGCSNFGLAARGHLDPKKTGKHLGPYNTQGHLGDIQPLMINKNGTVTLPVFAPKLKLSDISGRTLIIHANRDNYSDKPVAMGGCGDRVACGIVPGKVKLVSVAKKPKSAAVTKPVTPATVNQKPAVNAQSATTAPQKTQGVKPQSTNEQIEQLIERKRKLQAMQQQSHHMLELMKKR